MATSAGAVYWSGRRLPERRGPRRACNPASQGTSRLGDGVLEPNCLPDRPSLARPARHNVGQRRRLGGPGAPDRRPQLQRDAGSPAGPLGGGPPGEAHHLRRYEAPGPAKNTVRARAHMQKDVSGVRAAVPRRAGRNDYGAAAASGVRAVWRPSAGPNSRRPGEACVVSTGYSGRRAGQ